MRMLGRGPGELYASVMFSLLKVLKQTWQKEFEILDDGNMDVIFSTLLCISEDI